MKRDVVADTPLPVARPDLARSGRDPYPTLDEDTEEIIFANEAKDNRPWKKACEDCAFRDPPQRECYLRRTAETQTHFYCVHRTDKGENRVCAGFAAFLKTRGEHR